MRPIETTYKGYRFRSRLEARWAIFFDALQIEWEYEPQGFEFGGERYLPDFYLPRFNGGIYVEIKPTEAPDFGKAQRFAEQGKNILCLNGPPSNKDYTLFVGCGRDGHQQELQTHAVCFNAKYLPGGRNGDEYRLYDCPEPHSGIDAWGTDAAIATARGARFEFGESEGGSL